jgi:hypothetical protein
MIKPCSLNLKKEENEVKKSENINMVVFNIIKVAF